MTLDERIQELKDRWERGEKLNAKEKKLLDRKIWEEKEWRDFKVHPDDTIGDINAFTLTIPGADKEAWASGDAAVCEDLTLTAPGQTLFKNAQFKVVMGRRYGFLGPNGQGKTTIMRHVWQRKFPVPLDWDILLVEQEAKASNRNVVDEVMAADEK